MAEYYKYKPRDPQAQINWAEVGSNFSNILKDEAEFRENKKAAIDEATRNFQKELNNVPQGESTTIGEWGLNYSADAQKQMLMVEKLLKSGQLKPRDYTVMRQNLVDGTEEAFSLIEDYQAVYKKKMERFKSDDIANSSQLLETWLMEQAEGFGNFSKSQLVINNETSKVSAAFKKLNPDTGVMEISGNPNDLVSVSSLRGQILAEYDEYDMEGTTSEFIENTGAWTSISKIRGSRLSAGQIITTISPFDKKITKEDREKLGLTDDDAEAINYYLEAEDAYIGGVLSSNGGLNTTSILTENVGRFKKKDGTFANYDFTYDVDEAKADGSLILMTREGGVNRPVFDEKINPNAKQQVETATAAMRNSMRNKANQAKQSQNVNDWKALPINPYETSGGDPDNVPNRGNFHTSKGYWITEQLSGIGLARDFTKDPFKDGDDVVIAKQLEDRFGKNGTSPLGITAEPIGGLSNIVRVTLPGQTPIEISTNNYTKEGGLNERNKLTSYIQIGTRKFDEGNAKKYGWERENLDKFGYVIDPATKTSFNPENVPDDEVPMSGYYQAKKNQTEFNKKIADINRLPNK
tara:strand:- start:5614 stop:7350 length:1737 start_codon:yes stop_codon:yes gene_type:complete